MSFVIRPLTPADAPFLWEMLYQALYVPPGEAPFPREIVNQPEISRYVQDWGQPHDSGSLALDADQAIGAAWLRLFPRANPGFGFIAEDVPELSIAVLPEYRGQGIGSQLLIQLLEAARLRYRAVSLSVDARNPAAWLYSRFGFEVVSAQTHSLTMCRAWRSG